MPPIIARLVRTALCTLMFFAVGEVLLRVDQTARFFQGERHVVVDKNLRETPELAAVRTRSLPMRDGDLRVMILGDSYIQGGGIAPDATFSSRLRGMLEQDRRLSGRRVHVLDASMGGSNSILNHRNYFDLVEGFRPHVVFLAYNSNDVYSWGIAPPTAPARRESQDSTPVAGAPAAPASEPMGRVVRRMLFGSEVLKFVLQQTNLQLKLRGVVVPGTEFHHQVREAYSGRSAAWPQSQAALREMIADTEARKGVFIAYSMPEFNMLRRYDVFEQVDTQIARFFQSQPVVYVRGADHFIGDADTDFALSRYDGHPNAEAHAAIAQQAYAIIAAQVLQGR